MRTKREPRIMTVCDIINEMSDDVNVRQLLGEPDEKCDDLEAKYLANKTAYDLEKWDEAERDWFNAHLEDQYEVDWGSHVIGTPINRDAYFSLIR